VVYYNIYLSIYIYIYLIMSDIETKNELIPASLREIDYFIKDLEIVENIEIEMDEKEEECVKRYGAFFHFGLPKKYIILQFLRRSYKKNISNLNQMSQRKVLELTQYVKSLLNCKQYNIHTNLTIEEIIKMLSSDVLNILSDTMFKNLKQIVKQYYNIMQEIKTTFCNAFNHQFPLVRAISEHGILTWFNDHNPSDNFSFIECFDGVFIRDSIVYKLSKLEDKYTIIRAV